MQRFIVPVVIVAALAILAAIGSGAPPAEAQGRPPATTNIQIVNGHNPGEVIISWDAVPAATHYRIGYVNMAIDYPLAKSTEGGRTGNWLEAFVYVDVEAQNFVTSGTVYTIRRLGTGRPACVRRLDQRFCLWRTHLAHYQPTLEVSGGYRTRAGPAQPRRRLLLPHPLPRRPLPSRTRNWPAGSGPPWRRLSSPTLPVIPVAALALWCVPMGWWSPTGTWLMTPAPLRCG